MKFLWPQMLWWLVVAPVLVAAYVLWLRRRKKGAIRYSSLALVKAAMGPSDRLRRHLPPAILLLSLVTMIVALARPTALVTLPSQQQTIILVIDVSLSMGATDVDPNRITAAQAAAKAFVEERPPNARIGIVAFGANAALVQPPTEDKESLLAAIDRFELQRGTATGSALYVALATLFPDAGIDLESLTFPGGFYGGAGRARRLDPKSKPEPKAFTPVPPGSNTTSVIILMSDGRRTTGPDPLDAAKVAADHGVRVFTVGFGTAAGGLIGFEGWSVYVRLDEETLKSVADVTRGEYFYAGTAADLRKVYQQLNSRLVLERKNVEITSLITMAATLLVVIALGLSLLWSSRNLR
ncbi:MAG: VWA domain-containing protein [Casimicrobiaceae bacterium]|nr:VWA domain-containing protein [Pseudomonadota bacterium]